MASLREACAVFGVSLKEGEEAPGLCYNGLLSLQHRGQEGAGIALSKDNALLCKKGLGLVSEAFSPETLRDLPPARAAHAAPWAYQSPSATSVNSAGLSAAGLPAMRHRVVTVWPRVRTPSGAKMVSLTPVIRPFS